MAKIEVEFIFEDEETDELNESYKIVDMFI